MTGDQVKRLLATGVASSEPQHDGRELDSQTDSRLGRDRGGALVATFFINLQKRRVRD